jgi:hypothetical protein
MADFDVRPDLVNAELREAVTVRRDEFATDAQVLAEMFMSSATSKAQAVPGRVR